MLDVSIILITAFVIEIITLVGRFVFKIRADEIYKILGKKSKRSLIRVHHLVWGLLLALTALLFEYELLVNLGLGVALSDVIHHIILKIITGSYEFRGPIERY